jgi:predicted amino acid dehydrogenase
MAETLVCGLLGVTESFSLGPLKKEKVILAMQMAEKVGVSLGDLRGGS